ncbi:MAG: hypothetical protein KUG68_09365 [Flavobacteriaceae bacterium]|nr:hypothetical protein [Flavobacteriaceae bacterium]
MKKVLLFAAFAVFAFTASSAQGQFRAGINAGLPIGDAGDFYSFNVGLDISMLWEVAESFEAGVASGYSHSFGDEIDLGAFGTIDVEDAQYIPIAAAARYMLSEQFSLGADIGYALGIGDGVDGGFYYRPRVAYGVGENTDIIFSYTGVSDDGFTFNTINLGVDFGL